MKLVDISKIPPVTHELMCVDTKLGKVVTIIDENIEHIDKLRKWLKTTADVDMTPGTFHAKVILHVEVHQNGKETIEYFVEISDKVMDMISKNHMIMISSTTGEIVMMSDVTCESELKSMIVMGRLAKSMGFVRQ